MNETNSLFLVRTFCATYNHENYITDALNGFVMQQTTFPVVYTIIDDASTDSTPDVIRKFVSDGFDLNEPIVGYEKDTDYGHVTFARHKTNKNCYFAVIYLKENHYSQKKSRAPYLTEWMDTKYIALCEGDDYWIDPLKLQKQVDYLEEHDDVGLCFTDYCIREGERIRVESVFENGIDRIPNGFEDHLLRAGYIAPMSWLYRASYLPQLNDLKYFSDGSFSMALLFYHDSKVAYLPVQTSVYRVLPGSASRPETKAGQLKFGVGVLKTQVYYAELYGMKEDILKKIKSKAYFQMLPLALEAGEKEFVREAEAFFDSNNMYFPELLALCRGKIDLQKHYDKAQKELGVVRKSKAYKLGHFILDPYRKLIK